MKKYILLLALLVSFSTVARTDCARMWRGEKRAWILNDYVRVGNAPKGISVKTGTACEVRYLTRPMGTHYTSLADRVDWGSEAVGLKMIEVKVEPEVKAGVYQIGDLELTVVDHVLPPPSEWKYYLDLWQHPWAVARYFSVKPFSPAHYAKMRPLWELLADAGNKTLTVTLLDQPWNHQCYDAYGSMIRHIKCKDGSWKFDYKIFDEYVTFGRSCGLGQHIACYTMCPWGYLVTWEDEDGGIHKAKAVPGTPEFKEYWGDFLVDFAKHLKEKGWFDSTYICMDERAPEDVRNICMFVEEKAKGMKISLAGNQSPSNFNGIHIDNACFCLSHLTDQLISEASDRRQKGQITTFYVCCWPPHPNTMCPCELAESFWLGAYPAMVGLDGFLRWAWNSWPQDPMRDLSYGDWPAGDTYLVYPNGSPSLRFLELRKGIVAAEKIRILKEKGLLTDEYKKVAALYSDRVQAQENKSDFISIREQTMNLVNLD